jgi:predicted Zn-dependent protease
MTDRSLRLTTLSGAIFTAFALSSLGLSAGLFPSAALAQQKQAAPVSPQTDIDKVEGVKVGPKSRALRFANADEVERTAGVQYEQLKQQSKQQGALAPDDYPPLIRVRKIAERMIPHTLRWNERAKNWRWEINLIGSKQINAFCMPGGKIAFYTGIIDSLKLTDDEIATVMGHEIAHALREHGREREGKARVAQVVTIGASVLSSILGYGNLGGQVASQATQLTLLKYGREDETEGDLLGMDIAARSGYDPRAGIKLWEKMATVAKGAPPQWLSTHPSHVKRIDDIRKHLLETMPIYALSKGVNVKDLPPYQSNFGNPVP